MKRTKENHLLHTRKSLLLFSMLLFLVGFLSISLAQKADALSGSQFNAGRIIDNGVFYNSHSMTVTQIQNFLNAKVPTCDTNGTKPSGHSGYPTRADWGRAHGYAPPYTCLKNYSQNVPSITNSGSDLCSGSISGGAKSAARIIYDVGQACSINPQTLIVLLQKEQSLVTDEWPWSVQYRSATGYGCPDTAPCDSEYYGFFNQVYQAAQAFRRYERNPTNYNYRYGRNNTILWNPNAACGSSSVYIQNQATASLYIYTPYRPNQAALNNLYGTGNSCSSYGNRNFWRYFNDWFGSTQYSQPVGAQLLRQSSNGKIFLVTDSTRFYIPSPAILSAYNLSGYGAIPSTDSAVTNLADGGTLSTLVRNNGNVYLIDNGYKHYITGPSVCTNWALDCFNTNVAKAVGDDFFQGHLRTSSNVYNTAKLGSVYYKLSAGKRLPYANAQSFTAAGNSTSSTVSVQSYNLTQPLGPLQISTPGIIRFSPKPTIYYFNGTTYFAVADMDVYNAWGLGNIASLSVPTSSYNGADDVTSSSLSYWAADTSGSKYVGSGDGHKIPLNTTQQQLWPGATYITGLDSLLAKMSNEPLGSFIKAGPNFYKIDLTSHRKLYIASMADYIGLGGTSSNTTRVSVPLANSITSGPYAFADGRLIKVQDDTTIYVMNKSTLSHVASMAILKAYNFNTSNMKTYPLSGISEYPDGGTLRHGKLSNSSAAIAHAGKLIMLSSSQVSYYGLDTSGFNDISQSLTARATKVNATQFFRNSDDGRIYYASGGSIHYVSSQASFKKYGGPTTRVVSVDSSIIALFSLGSPI